MITGKRLQARRGGAGGSSTTNRGRSRKVSLASIAAIFGVGICLAITLMALGWWYIVSASSLGPRQEDAIGTHDVSKLRRRTTTSTAKIRRPVTNLKLPTPVLVMGMPKVGTTSITAYFRCGKIKASHFSCEVNDDDDLTRPWRNCLLPKGAGGAGSDSSKAPLCGVCIERNVLRGRPPLEGCGDYELWGELDSAEHPLPLIRHDGTGTTATKDTKKANQDDVQPLCSFPQITHLDELHAAYPNATLILNTRPAENWIRSISQWNPTPDRVADKGYLRRVLAQCDLPGFSSGVGETDEELALFYNSHSERIRSFVQQHPSHALVEINIEDDNSGRVLESNFGISHQCWGKQNAATVAQNPNRSYTDPTKSRAESVGSARILGQPRQDTHVVTGVDKKHNFSEALSQVQAMADLMFDQYSKQKEYNADLALDYPYCSDIQDIFPSPPRRPLTMQ
mmetsp:Transcript_16919/g.33768  ORF Transcript_16919/g.33768 Transcript_16919/m.33768 type:complete len:453 (-) Transcript_16919:1975-3333(-)